MQTDMSRALKAGLERYPVVLKGTQTTILYGDVPVDINLGKRIIFIDAYRQAEKDTIAIIESRLSELLGDAQPTPILRSELQDLIKKIKEEEQ